jgi:hypothetical protein
MKQTAVEFLLINLLNKFPREMQYLFELDKNLIEDMLIQAKEMEKQQMRDASCPFIGGWEDDEFEYWYNETFKNK